MTQQKTVLCAWRESAKIAPATIARLMRVPVVMFTALEDGRLVPDADLGSALELLFCASFPAGLLLAPYNNGSGMLGKLSEAFADFARATIAGQQKRIA